MLALLTRVYSEGIGWTVWDAQRRADRHRAPTRVSARLIGQVLLWEWAALAQMARLYDKQEWAALRRIPDAPEDENEARSKQGDRKTDAERHLGEMQRMMRKATGDPTDDAAVERDVDAHLRWESGHLKPKWPKELNLNKSTFAAQAGALGDELGDRFIRGTPAEREVMVRDWLRNYRGQGRLPPTKPPAPAAARASPEPDPPYRAPAPRAPDRPRCALMKPSQRISEE